MFQPNDELEFDLVLEDEPNQTSTSTTKPKKNTDEDIHIDWNQNIPAKASSDNWISSNPNDFFNQNLQFLTGQKSSSDIEKVKKPIFRLAISLDSGSSSLAKRIHVPNATNPSQIDNVPSDYYNIIQPENLDNLSVFFLDFTFSWVIDNDGKTWLKPEWIGKSVVPVYVPGESKNVMKPIPSLLTFHLRPFGKPKNGIIYTDNNPSCKQFWNKIIPSFDFDEEMKEKYSKIYTIWFQKKYFGFNILEEIFKDNSFYRQVKYFKDTCLNKKIIDLFDLSDLISKNDMISKKNNIFLLFTKWLNYKNTNISSTSDIYNKKSLEQSKSENITIDYFKRLDDLFYYLTKCFFNILDQCLYENSINQMGSKGILLEDFFEKDYALGGVNQDSSQEFIEFVNEEPQQHSHELTDKELKETKKSKTVKSKKTRGRK